MSCCDPDRTHVPCAVPSGGSGLVGNFSNQVFDFKTTIPTFRLSLLLPGQSFTAVLTSRDVPNFSILCVSARAHRTYPASASIMTKMKSSALSMLQSFLPSVYRGCHVWCSWPQIAFACAVLRTNAVLCWERPAVQSSGGSCNSRTCMSSKFSPI